jgi:hypothetical protein
MYLQRSTHCLAQDTADSVSPCPERRESRTIRLSCHPQLFGGIAGYLLGRNQRAVGHAILRVPPSSGSTISNRV